jgi:hypothetical protein
MGFKNQIWDNLTLTVIVPNLIFNLIIWQCALQTLFLHSFEKGSIINVLFSSDITYISPTMTVYKHYFQKLALISLPSGLSTHCNDKFNLKLLI